MKALASNGSTGKPASKSKRTRRPRKELNKYKLHPGWNCRTVKKTIVKAKGSARRRGLELNNVLRQQFSTSLSNKSTRKLRESCGNHFVNSCDLKFQKQCLRFYPKTSISKASDQHPQGPRTIHECYKWPAVFLDRLFKAFGRQKVIAKLRAWKWDVSTTFSGIGAPESV